MRARGLSAAVLAAALVARSLDPIQSALGFAITPNGVLDDADVVIVTDIAIPGTADLHAIWATELDWLRERHAAGAILCSVCTGTTVLAEAGLLDVLTSDYVPGSLLHAAFLLAEATGDVPAAMATWPRAVSLSGRADGGAASPTRLC